MKKSNFVAFNIASMQFYPSAEKVPGWQNCISYKTENWKLRVIRAGERNRLHTFPHSCYSCYTQLKTHKSDSSSKCLRHPSPSSMSHFPRDMLWLVCAYWRSGKNLTFLLNDTWIMHLHSSKEMFNWKVRSVLMPPISISSFAVALLSFNQRMA